MECARSQGGGTGPPPCLRPARGYLVPLGDSLLGGGGGVVSVPVPVPVEGLEGLGEVPMPVPVPIEPADMMSRLFTLTVLPDPE